MGGFGADRKLRVAVLGLGTMGRQHARVLSDLDGDELVAVSDDAPDAQAWAKDVLRVPCLADWRAVVAAGAEAVVNALPTGRHFDVTRALLADGMHVLVEKPIAIEVDEAAELIELAEQRGLLLGVGHTERFNPAVEALQKAIANDRLGRIVSLAARRVGVARPAVPATGVAIDLAIHDIDVFSFLLGGRRGELLYAAGASLD